jgi:hypothetical protein
MRCAAGLGHGKENPMTRYETYLVARILDTLEAAGLVDAGIYSARDARAASASWNGAWADAWSREAMALGRELGGDA